MKKYLILFLMLLVSLGFWLFWQEVNHSSRTVRPIASPTTAKSSQLAKLKQQCANSGEQDGFGRALISGQILIEASKAAIGRPCELLIQAGASLTISGSKLSTKNLVISDDPTASLSSHLQIVNSNLNGQKSGFQVLLKAPGSQMSITNSSFDYDLSLGVTVGTSGPASGAKLTVSHSRFRSVGTNSEGINLVSTGQGLFDHNDFVLMGHQTALLLAPNCVLENNVGANQRCLSQ
jgi:hypothetical protein